MENTFKKDTYPVFIHFFGKNGASIIDDRENLSPKYADEYIAKMEVGEIIQCVENFMQPIKVELYTGDVFSFRYEDFYADVMKDFSSFAKRFKEIAMDCQQEAEFALSFDLANCGGVLRRMVDLYKANRVSGTAVDNFAKFYTSAESQDAEVYDVIRTFKNSRPNLWSDIRAMGPSAEQKVVGLVNTIKTLVADDRTREALSIDFGTKESNLKLTLYNFLERRKQFENLNNDPVALLNYILKSPEKFKISSVVWK